MDEDDFREEWDRAVDIGAENLAILQLAAAWCQKVGQTTGGHLGVGMIQQMTGLPISGGSLRCEHAKGPTSFGMRLAGSAVEFYLDNCVGCTHRKPTDAVEHLGTYVDEVVAERKESQQEAERQRRDREAERQKRRDGRRMAFGVADPSGQSLLDLIERVDSEDRDPEAERLLIRFAELAPTDFSDELLAHLTREAVAIGNTPILESVVAVFERDGRPPIDQMLRVAFNAIAVGVASRACGRVISAHAQAFEVPDGTIRAIIHLAAGNLDSFRGHDWTGGEPGALLRLFDVSPDLAISGMSGCLLDPEPWIRSMAAEASAGLISARPEAGLKLLPILLDSCVIPDKSSSLGDPFAAAGARKVVSDLLVTHVEGTRAELTARLKTADGKAIDRLWECFDWAARDRLRGSDPLPREVGRAICEAATSLLGRGNVSPDLKRSVADTLSLVASYHPTAVSLSLDMITDLLTVAARAYEQFDSATWSPPAGATLEQAFSGGLQHDSDRMTLSSVTRELKDALESIAKHDTPGFLNMVRDHGWASTDGSPIARSALVEVVGKVVRSDADLRLVADLLRAAGRSSSNRERAEAIEAIGEIAGRGVSIPPELSDIVLDGIDDQYEIVALAAVRSVDALELPADRLVKVINFLLSFAAAYGPKRKYDDDVRHALGSVWRMSTGQPYEQQAQDTVMAVIARLPHTEAVELLDRFAAAQKHRAWPAITVASLFEDEDAEYRGLHERQRFELLRRLAAEDASRIASVFDQLVAVGKEKLWSTGWVWAASDVLAIHGEHARAAEVCDALVATMPDTREYGPRRRYARVMAIGHHLNAAVTVGDTAASAKCLEEWSQISNEMRSHE